MKMPTPAPLSLFQLVKIELRGVGAGKSFKMCYVIG